MVIQPEDEDYSVPEGPVQYHIIPIVLIGMKEPGLECNVTVHTEDIPGGAIGKLRIKNTYSIHFILHINVCYFKIINKHVNH